MDDDFKILLEFFDAESQEVGGRAAATISPDLREMIAKVAAGDCTETERAEVKKLLQEQPHLIPILVTETTSLRPSDK
ncbi:MAG: hypothetical protein DLM73_04760 [Chthoniobacterales bacterium]|nr:MAG: hypothetical protein DLM73_04760 [Chthoniobacterales bacterium]